MKIKMLGVGLGLEYPNWDWDATREEASEVAGQFYFLLSAVIKSVFTF